MNPEDSLIPEIWSNAILRRMEESLVYSRLMADSLKEELQTRSRKAQFRKDAYE